MIALLLLLLQAHVETGTYRGQTIVATDGAHGRTFAAFHPVSVKDLPTSRWTHVDVCGTVTLRKREADGDWHLRIQDGQRFIVAEIIPALPIAPPALKQRVCVQGISREDKAHGWAEVHPVLSWRAQQTNR